MTTKQIKQLIAKGEGIEVEFKESYNSLARSVYETICAFLNRRGGHILLGVKDDKTITGVNEASIPAQLDTLAKDMNNPPDHHAHVLFVKPSYHHWRQKNHLYLRAGKFSTP